MLYDGVPLKTGVAFSQGFCRWQNMFVMSKGVFSVSPPPTVCMGYVPPHCMYGICPPHCMYGICPPPLYVWDMSPPLYVWDMSPHCMYGICPPTVSMGYAAGWPPPVLCFSAHPLPRPHSFKQWLSELSKACTDPVLTVTWAPDPSLSSTYAFLHLSTPSRDRWVEGWRGGGGDV